MLVEFHFDWNDHDVDSVCEALEPCVTMIGWQENIKETPLPRIFEGITTNDKVAELFLRLEILATSKGLRVPDFQFCPVEDKDYLAENQKSFPPIEIENFYIYGSHINETPPSDKICLLLDAASAFGSGHHESTKGCLMAIEELAKQHTFTNPLDLGCGSGILALSMAKRMSTHVTASDIDEESVRVTKENAKINHINCIDAYISDGFASEALCSHAPFDLIVANILANPLCTLAPKIAKYCSKNGHVILSGLLNEQRESVLDAYEKEGFKLVKDYVLGAWTTLSLIL